MSKPNEILKSLADLEQSLKDIKSAKEQVTMVIDSSEKLANIIESYKASFDSLSKNVQKTIESSKNFNLETITKLSEQTGIFSSEVSKIIEFDFAKTMLSAEKVMINIFEQHLTERFLVIDNKMQDFQNQIDELKSQISRIESFDIEKSFEKHELLLHEVIALVKKKKIIF